jgi:hypothetical protein
MTLLILSICTSRPLRLDLDRRVRHSRLLPGVGDVVEGDRHSRSRQLLKLPRLDLHGSALRGNGRGYLYELMGYRLQAR